jgi:TonB family protein
MRPGRVAVLAVLLVPMVAGAATRHTAGDSLPAPATAARDTAGCLDTLHASDSVSAVVTMSVRTQNPETKLPPDFEDLFVLEFKSRLKVPASLPLSVMGGWMPCDSRRRGCVSGVLMLGSRAYLSARPTGTLSRAGVIDFSLTPAFSDSVRAVLERISEERMSPFFNGKDSIPVEIVIGVEPNPDSVPRVRHLFRVTIPHYRLPFTFASSPKAVMPHYPPLAQARGIDDSVAVTFTVLPDGTVAPQSVDVQAGNHIDFIRSVFEKLSTTRYVPARIGSCPVATWTGQSFSFKLR